MTKYEHLVLRIKEIHRPIHNDTYDIDMCDNCYQQWPCDTVSLVGHKLENSEEILTNTHPAKLCEGQPCTIHNMSDHSMRSFPQHYRGDRGFMERICPHGIGHPDPDDILDKFEAVHGCDGCCA